MIKGYVFSNQLASNDVDALVFRKMLDYNNGVLNGMALSNTNTDITVGEGNFLIAGRPVGIVGSETVTVGTDVEEGAYVFLDILLSEYVQKDFRDAIPVNRAAVMRKLERENSDNTAGFNRASKTSPDLLGSSLEDSLRQGALFDPADKVDEVFLNMLEEVDSVLIPDNSVLMIVSEEIPPYLIGQKDIGSVIDAVNSRTRLVFDER